MPLSLKFVSLATAAFLALTLPELPLPGFKLPAIAQTNQERKVEGDRLLQQGIEQFQTSQYEAALKSWEQALAIYRSLQLEFSLNSSCNDD